MKTLESRELLRRFVEESSEDAFTELVGRYTNLVHSVASRRSGGHRQLAQDIAQKVFTDLATQARQFPPDVLLGGWLHRHTCFIASTLMRGESRRIAREHLAAAMNPTVESPGHNWNDLAPLLDEAIDELPAPDRDAIVLRYFEQQNLRRVGASLGTTEDTAQKRVSRALEKLKVVLEQKGLTLTLAGLVSALDYQAVSAAPAGLAAALARGAIRPSVPAAGWAAGWLALLPSSSITVATALMVASVITIGIWWGQHRKDATPLSSAKSVAATSVETPSLPGLATAAAVDAPTNVRPGFVAAGADRGSMQLTLVAADSGKPLPNVEINYQASGESGEIKMALIANRNGICTIPLPPSNTSWFQLATRTEGFADTRLEWLPLRGEPIPTDYTLRVVRAARISGRVVDASGNPVAGAKVGLGYRDDPLLKTRPENHLFGSMAPTTDAEGHWSVHRIAPEMIRRLNADASHPAHVRSESLDVAARPEAERQLLDGTFVFRLGAPVTVEGTVVDPAGSPVANAKVLVGWLDEVNSRKGTTDNDGRFSVQGCRPGKTYLTAEADGFAATTLDVNLSPDSGPFQIKLEPGRRLVLRVTNRTNQPLAGASVFLRRENGPRPDDTDAGPPVQTTLPQNYTDSDGRLVWSNAPNREVFIVDVVHEGYLRRDHVPVRPDGTEQLIVLGPTLKLKGTVRDAAGGGLIPKFRLVLGWPDPNEARWSSLSRHWISFSHGVFQHSLDEPIVYNTRDPKLVVKVEAEGYAPAVSRVIRMDEGEAQLDILLRRAGENSVTVLRPDGQPAAGADVGFLSPYAGLTLSSGGFVRDGPLSSSLVRTDAMGKFELPPEAQTNDVLITHESGSAEVAAAALMPGSRIQLGPWGRIEGRYQTNSRPVPGQELRLAFIGRTSASLSSQFKAMTDAQGRFAFERVPAGRHTLELMIPFPPVQPTSWGHAPAEDVEVTPGQTTRILLGGKTYAFTVQLRWPEGLEPQPDWLTHLSLQTLLRPMAGAPADSTEAFFAARRTAGTCRVHLLDRQPAGHWTANDVRPGRHLVQVIVNRLGPDRRAVQQARGESWIDIPAEVPESAINLGEIILRRPAE